MSDVRLVARGSGKESFVVTRGQISGLVNKAYERGQNGGFKPRAFVCECDALQLNDWSGQQVARAKWLHIVTANHLRKARKTIRQLKSRLDTLQQEVRRQSGLIAAYRGAVGMNNPFGRVPEHYRGDGYVTCDRAIESASAQRCIVGRTPIQLWYWATAIKYVWRMWSKEDPEGDAMKAIDCLEKAAGLGRLVEIDGAEVVE